MRLLVATLIAIFFSLHPLANIVTAEEITIDVGDAKPNQTKDSTMTTIDGKPVKLSTCYANTCGTCSITCPEGKAARCYEGHMMGSISPTCVRGPSCSCSR